MADIARVDRYTLLTIIYLVGFVGFLGFVSMKEEKAQSTVFLQDVSHSIEEMANTPPPTKRANFLPITW